MATIVDEMRSAGFDDATIGSWANEQRPAMKAAGFDDDTIEGYFSGLKDPKKIPPAFLERFRKSTSLVDAAVEGAKAGFGDHPIGLVDSEKAALRRVGVYNDYDAPGGPAPGPVKYLRMANETLIDGGVKGVAGMFRGFNAALMSTGAVLGQVAYETGLSDLISERGKVTDEGARGRRDFAHMVVTGAMLAGTVSPVTKPGSVTNKMPNDTTLGHLPTAEDFTAAAKIVQRERENQHLADMNLYLGETAADDVLSRPSTPPAKPETVRFYHGGTEPASGGGRWVTTDPVYARDFRRSGEGDKPNEVHYVDIPKGDPTEVAARTWTPEDEAAGINNVGTYHHIEIPEAWAQKMQPAGEIVDKPAQPTVTMTEERAQIVKDWEENGTMPFETASDAKAYVAANPPKVASEPTLPTPGLSPEHAAIETRVAKKIADDYPAARAEYEALPDAEGGKVLNTDTARELSPDYAKDKVSRATLSQAVHEPVSAFVKKLYADKLAELPPDGTVLFTSGGAGAGKSNGIKSVVEMKAVADKADIIYDTNMNTLSGATTKIDQALAAGAKVEIIHVQRDPVTALREGALPRAMNVGRTVPLEHHMGTHVGAAETIIKLADHYKDNPNVVIHIIDNTGGRGEAKVGGLEIVHKTDYMGIRERLISALKDEYEKGNITEPVYRGTLGSWARSADEAGNPPRQSASDGRGSGDHVSGVQEERPSAGAQSGAREENPSSEVTPDQEAVSAAFGAGDAIASGKPIPPYVPDQVAQPGKLQPAGHFMFAAADLKVDAKRFQFKSDGDANGVNKALAGVTQWDTSKAGGVIVWEQKDGQLFIADGHQRTGLARRLEAQGHPPIEIPGVLYREKDGVASGDVMEIAASANIANGSGSALDGAKVLRNNPTLINGSLPLSTGKGKQAVALAKLKDEAFGFVVNEVVPENYGAVVGELIPNDGARQVAALKAIERFGPRNVDEAAALVNRVKAAELAKADKGTQGSMFGDLETAESTAGEEMKIVGRAIADLKKDKTLFARVVANAERIEQTGSKIEQETAKSVATDAEKFARTLASDAYSAGPIRNVLVAAARDLKNGNATLGDTSARVIAALRGETKDAVADRDGSGGKSGSTAKGDGAGQPEPAPGTYHKPIEETATAKPVADFIQHVEDELAAGRTDADIAPTTSKSDFRRAAEARGWTQDAYGKGSALWSPDRKHAMFVNAPVEGNHLNVQWVKPGADITPPKLKTEPGADGKPQGLIPGVEPLTVKEQIIEAARPEQKPADDGLFGSSMNEPELFDGKPPKRKPWKDMTETERKIDLLEQDAVAAKKLGISTEEYTRQREANIASVTNWLRDPRTIFEQAEDRAAGQDILDGVEGGSPKGLSAAAVDDPASATPTRILPAGRLGDAVRGAAERVTSIWRDIQMNTAPMVLGSKEAMAVLKDFANTMRRIRQDWTWEDAAIVKAFPDKESRARMWSASDEESVAIQLGESREHQGLVTLTSDERAMVEQLQTRMQATWVQARDVGMVEGEGLPSYTPRMLINVVAGEGKGPRALNAIGGNVSTTSARLKKRSHMMDFETEAAGKERFGDDVELARDIRSYPLAVADLEKAIAGRQLINDIKEIGKRAGTETVAEGGKPAGGQWFTIDNPAFKTWRPRLEKDAEGKWQTIKDAEGNIIFDQVPIHVHRDFEGPLRAVLDDQHGAFYQASMDLKGKTMSVIMNSPLIHNFVEYGRAFASMPGKMITFRVYRDGAKMLADHTQMREAIMEGMVPIGNRAFNQDITSIMEAPDMHAGRSLTADALAETFGNLPQKGMTRAEVKQSVREGVDKAGDFWHNTLLWDQIAKLQAGLYVNIKADMMAKGVDAKTAGYMAAHMANRYAGALPKEAMGHGATVIANSLLFSRSFTMGNLGVIKDMLNGMPRDVMAQIERDVGSVDPKAADYGRRIARNKAIAIVVTDIVLFHVVNSLLQSTINVIAGRKDAGEEAQGYADRMGKQFEKVKETPSALLHPFAMMESLSSTSENEPGKTNSVYVGRTKDGTAFYARNTIGKLGDEFEGWFQSPMEMLKKKEGTIFRPLMQTFANDKGFGQKVYNPYAETYEDKLKVVLAIGAHIAQGQTPQGQIKAGYDLATGQGDQRLNALQAFGPLLGTTFSKGAPGGPAVGELYRWHDEHKFIVDSKLPGWRRQIQGGDAAGAVTDMIQTGVPKGLAQFYVRTSLYPETRMTPRAMKDFFTGASPEQRSRMEDTLKRQQGAR